MVSPPCLVHGSTYNLLDVYFGTRPRQQLGCVSRGTRQRFSLVVDEDVKKINQPSKPNKQTRLTKEEHIISAHRCGAKWVGLTPLMDVGLVGHAQMDPVVALFRFVPVLAGNLKHSTNYRLFCLEAT